MLMLHQWSACYSMKLNVADFKSKDMVRYTLNITISGRYNSNLNIFFYFFLKTNLEIIFEILIALLYD